jgi:hypothetical protein
MLTKRAVACHITITHRNAIFIVTAVPVFVSTKEKRREEKRREEKRREEKRREEKRREEKKM